MSGDTTIERFEALRAQMSKSLDPMNFAYMAQLHK
jgi:hypothetical protein